MGIMSGDLSFPEKGKRKRKMKKYAVLKVLSLLSHHLFGKKTKTKNININTTLWLYSRAFRGCSFQATLLGMIL